MAMESSSPRHESPGLNISPEDRLRIYRKCFHDLDEQLMQLQVDSAEDTEVQLLQAEMRCLEELIMLFTDISSVVSSKLAGFDPSMLNADGLNMSLVTDILMLSATSPWTVFVAERAQWQLCYVSPSVRRVFGWKPSELLGAPAWDGCHTEDVASLQRMLLLKEASTAGTAMTYRRMRKDRTYATVQATGRAVGVGWYAWVEQDVTYNTLGNSSGNSSGTSTARPNESPSELSIFSQFTPTKTSIKGKVIDTEPVSSKRSRKLSSSQRNFEPDLSSKAWNGRPSSPLASAPLLERPSRPQKPKSEDAEPDSSSEAQETDDSKSNVKGMNSPNLTGYLGSELDKMKKGKTLQADVVPPKSKATLVTASSCSSTPSPSPRDEEVNALWKRKILLVEDDRINRTIAQKLLENLKCDVTVACNGKEALDILQAAPPPTAEEIESGKEIPPQFDLVLMDLMMPVMDGTKAVLHFRDWEELQEPPRKRMVIFALTSNVSDGDMVKCAISGFDEFVSKPLTIDKLLDRLASKR